MPIDPMLAHSFSLKRLKKYNKDYVFLQKKYDGMRTIWDGYNIFTRNGKEILSVPLLKDILIKNFKNFPLDGELYCHGMNFTEIISCVRRSVNLNEDKNIQYHIFDHPVKDIIYEDRYKILSSEIRSLNNKRIVLADTNRKNITKTEDISELNIYESLGYEGTMLRNPDGLYKFGKRSNDLLKLKSFFDIEAKVIDVVELRNYEKIIVPKGTSGSKEYADGTFYKNGKEELMDSLGAFKVQLKNGKIFEVGSGLNDIQRKDFWKNPPIGKSITVKYQELSEDGIPRFGVFKCIRDYE